MGSFGEMVRKRRRDRGLSVIDLADAISKRAGANVSRSHINFIEIGRNLPTYRAAIALAEELDIDPEKALKSTFKDRVEHYRARERDYLEEFLRENKTVRVDIDRITK